MKFNKSGCVSSFAAGLSRIFLVIVWIARPDNFTPVFSSWIWPCLGFFLLPFTTLMYIFLYTRGGTLAGLDWLWLILAVVLDVGSIGVAADGNRDKIPQGYPGALPPETPASKP